MLEFNSFPIRTQRCFDVYLTLSKRYGRCIDVEATLCAYRVGKFTVSGLIKGFLCQVYLTMAIPFNTLC